MFKKFALFKKNGTSSGEIKKEQKIMLVFCILLSNLFFYLLVLSPSEKVEKKLHFPTSTKLVQLSLELQNHLRFETTQPYQLYNQDQKLLSTEVYFVHFADKDQNLAVLMVPESEVEALTFGSQNFYLLPTKKTLPTKKWVKHVGEQYEILF